MVLCIYKNSLISSVIEMVVVERLDSQRETDI
jgi:hypothetical protein